MGPAIPLSLIVATLCAAGGAVAEPLVCPSSDKLAISLAAPGWISISSITHPHGAPVLEFVSIRTDGSDTRCMHRVKGGGILTMAYHAVCKPSKGKWQEQGVARQCEASVPDQCVLDCEKKP